MNEEQYRSLCEACDRVLSAPDSTIERAAIPWLHVIREHPVFLANYADLFDPARGVKAIVRHWLRVLRSRAVWFRQLGRALRSDGQPWVGPKELPGRIDVLFVSHLLNASHAGQASDFYFGELPNELVAHGHSAVVALINYSVQPGMVLAETWKESVVPRVILSGSLGILEEAALHRRLKKESFRLRRLASKETAGLYRKVLMRASQEALSGGSQTTLRMARQIGGLVAKLKPKAIVVTHEGHAWERMAFAAARSVVPEVRCIGYQHAMLFRLQHAIRRSFAPEYNPDQILTAGTVSKSQLERAPGLDGIPISVLGSNRSLKGAAINGGATDRKQAGHSDSPACLVLPEGIVSECHLLFEFSLACARVFPEIQFIWRLHPLVNYESLAARNHKLRNLPRNIVLSKAILEDDIARSRWTLYRGTTAVVPAVVAGLRPIYLALPGELTIDPLYELDVWRTKVASVSEFQRAIRPDVDSCHGSSESDLELARRYCESHFLPPDVGALAALIPESFKEEAIQLKISTVIPTRNRPADLVRAIASVYRQARLPDQLLIIDQSPGIESKNAIMALAPAATPGFELIYVHDPSIAGLVPAKEYSLGVSNGDIVMFLEDDVVLEEDYIQNLGRAFVDNPEMMGACGVVLDAPGTGMLYQKLFHLFHRGIFHDRRVGVHGNPAAWVQKLIPSTYLSGGVSAYRRAVFNKVKFDTRNDFFMLEDIDFSTRAVCEFGADRFFINTSARLTHFMSPVNRARLAGRYERKLREFVVFYKKNRGQASSLANLLWLLVGLSFEAIVAAARARHIGPLSGSIKGLLDGIKWRVRA